MRSADRLHLAKERGGDLLRFQIRDNRDPLVTLKLEADGDGVECPRLQFIIESDVL